MTPADIPAGALNYRRKGSRWMQIGTTLLSFHFTGILTRAVRSNFRKGFVFLDIQFLSAPCAKSNCYP
jgi:hypothetical protein